MVSRKNRRMFVLSLEAVFTSRMREFPRRFVRFKNGGLQMVYLWTIQTHDRLTCCCVFANRKLGNFWTIVLLNTSSRMLGLGHILISMTHNKHQTCFSDTCICVSK